MSGMTMALWLFGCPGPDGIGDGSGLPVWTMFPFDGERTWEYTSTDETLGYRWIVRSSGEPDLVDGTAIYTLVTETSCFGADPGCVDGEVVRRTKWSSTSADGVRIHGYDPGDGFVDLLPPVRLVADEADRGDVVETVSGEATWTATMGGLEPCPGNPTWTECGVFELAVDTGDGAPIAGTYHATVGNGIAAFELAPEAGVWQLTDGDCSGDCDGSW